MITNLEIEYKQLLTKQQFELFRSFYAPIIFVKQVNTYYDTKDLTIRKQKSSLRIREIENRYLCTLKKHTINGSMEYEKYVKANDPDMFKDVELSGLLSSFHMKAELIPLAQLTTYRAVIHTGQADLCLDYNIYHGIEDYEIEYECKKDHDGLHEFKKILHIFHIDYQANKTSKSKRALLANHIL